MVRGIKDYFRSGGWAGHSVRTFQAELQRALDNKKDVLHTIAKDFKAGNIQPALQKLVTIFIKRPQKLSESTKAFLTVLFANAAIEFAEQNLDNDEILAQLPPQTVKYAAIGAGEKSALRRSKSEAGRQKGKKDKEKVIGDWNKRENKEISYSAWAMSYFKKNGGKFDADGKALGRPTPRTIARWLGEYKPRHNEK